MTPEAPVKRSLTTGRALIYGTLIVAVLDGLDAVVFFGIRGVRPIRIFQSIAAGIAVYIVMNFVVIPLSAARGGVGTWPVILNGLLIHMIGVGLPAVLVARAASPQRRLGVPQL